MLQSIRDLFNQSRRRSGAFDYQLYAFAASLSLMSSILLGADFSDANQVQGLVLSNLLAFKGLFILLLTLERTIFRGKTTIGLGVLVVLGLIVGFTKGLLTGLGMYWFGHEDDFVEAIGSRVWQTTLIGVWAVPFITLLGLLRARYAEQREALIGEKVVREATDDDYGTSLRGFVAIAKSKLEAYAKDPRADLSAEIRRLVDQDLRPLSHKIWLRESRKFPNYRARDLMRVAIFRYVYFPHLVVPVWLLTTIVPTLIFYDPPSGFLVSIARAIFLYLALRLALRFRVRSLSAAWVKYVIWMVLINFGQSVIGYLVTGALELPDDLGVIASNAIWLLQLTLLSGLGWTFFVSDRKVESELVELLGEAKLREPDWIRAFKLRDRQLAQFLHNHLQPQLVSTALRLDQDAQTTLPEKIKLIEQVLEDAAERFSAPSEDSMERFNSELLANWHGIVELDLESIELQSEVAGQAYEVINEAISNALRHGYASEVRVRMRFVQQGVEIIVTDNGTGPRNGIPGLGSYYFDSVSLDWGLTRGEAGAVLRVLLAT